MSKPLLLELYPHERHPTKRAVGTTLPEPPLIINDMPHLAQYVYDFYIEEVKKIKDNLQVNYFLFNLDF